VDAARDLIGVVRALAMLERDPTGQQSLHQAAQELDDALQIFAISDLGSPEYEAAEHKTRGAVALARSTIHVNRGELSMLLGAAAKRLRELQGRSW
jgi:hypothetical protein